jgi:hypothetical protein
VRKLRLSDWASIAEIGGTLAVVISLLFVAYSLERNTTAVSGQTADEMYDAVRQVELTLFSNPELMMVTMRGKADFDGLSDVEKEQYKQWVIIYLDLWERMYAREVDGLIQRETVLGWHEYFTEWSKRYITPDIWEEIGWNWPGDTGFYELVDAAVSD